MDQRLTFAYSWILWSLPLVLAALAAFLHFSWRRRQELTGASSSPASWPP